MKLKPCPNPACKNEQVSYKSGWRGSDPNFSVYCYLCKMEGPSAVYEEGAFIAWNDLPRGTSKKFSILHDLIRKWRLVSDTYEKCGNWATAISVRNVINELERIIESAPPKREKLKLSKLAQNLTPHQMIEIFYDGSTALVTNEPKDPGAVYKHFALIAELKQHLLSMAKKEVL